MSERDIFNAAREMTDPVARSTYLDEACGGDRALRDRVEALLRAHNQPDSLLDAPLVSPPDENRAATEVFAPNPDAKMNRARAADVSDDEPFTFLAPSARPDSLGRIGHYEVLQVLGKGGFGIVFRAFDDILQRVVAIKVMAPHLAATSPPRKRFLREARSSASIRHDNVVQVYEVAEQPLPYLVMEFIPGETLQQKLDRNGPLEVSEVVRLGRQIAEGLAAAHATDLIHRDIKPANVLIEGGPQQRVKITDFGLARAADDASISQSGIIAGTPMYMAPEQVQGRTLDRRADLFSLGSVLYQMVTGRPPFRANNTMAVLKRVSEDAPRPIREIVPETPKWMCEIIAKLHEKTPEDRYQSAREVADVLADCEGQLKTPLSVRDFGRIPKSARSRSHSHWKQFAQVSALAGLMAAFLFVANFATRYFRDKGVIEIQPSNGLLDVIVQQDGEAITDSFDLHKQTKLFNLPSGIYQLEPRFAIGRTLERWEITTRGLVGSNTMWQLNQVCEIELSRGERVSIRAVMRDAPDPPLDSHRSGSIWAPLFSGKNLKGWNTSDPTAWKVENGALVGTAQDEKFTYLISDRDNYANFHLRAEVKINGEGDSGIYFRNIHETSGYEAQINCNPADPHATGSLALRRKVDDGEQWQWLQTVSKSPVPPDTWFTFEIIAKENVITLLINGTEVSRSSDRTNRRGGISLELGKMGTVVRFRRIEIKEFE